LSKEEFVSELDKYLKKLNSFERKKFISYYEEMIEDYKENGFSEEDAVSKVGNPELIAHEIIGEQESVIIKIPSTRSTGLNIVLIVLGFPLWGSILLSGIMLILCIYIIIWCIPVMTGALAVGSFVVALISIFASFFVMVDKFAIGLIQLGLGIVSIGAMIISVYLTIIFSKKLFIVTNKFTSYISGVFHKKVVRG